MDRLGFLGEARRADQKEPRRQTPFSISRTIGRYKLIRELHAQKLTLSQIKEHLAAGKTSTGQVVNLSLGRLWGKLHDMGLKAALYPAGYYSARQKAAELHREGRSMEWIAEHFKQEGFVTASGKPWTLSMVDGLLHTLGEKAQSLEDTHRRLIADALARGLSLSEIAREFNEKKIRRLGRPPWTARSVANTCRKLNLPEPGREQEGSMKTEPFDSLTVGSAEQKLSSDKRPPSTRRYRASRSRNIRRQSTSIHSAERGRAGTKVQTSRD